MTIHDNYFLRKKVVENIGGSQNVNTVSHKYYDVRVGVA